MYKLICPGFPNCSDYNSKEKRDKIAIKQKEQNIIILCREILYLKAKEQYTHINLTNGKKILSPKNLVYFEKLLPDCFCRIHHNTILNMHFIKVVQKEKNNIILTLDNGLKHKTSYRKKKILLDKMDVLKGARIKA